MGHAVRRERVSLLTRLGPDRVVGLAVAGIVLGASVISVSAGSPGSAGPVGGPTGNGDGPRIAVGGGAGLQRTNPSDGYDEYEGTGSDIIYTHVPSADLREADLLGNVDSGGTPSGVTLAAINGPFLADGTLLKPVAVDTTVADGSDLLRTYKVKSGDTLTGDRQQVRRLDDDVVVGQQARLQGRAPPRPGPHDPADERARRHGRRRRHARDAIAAKYKVDKPDILETNELDGPEPRRRPGPRPAGREGQADPDPQARQAPEPSASRARQRRRRLEAARPPGTPVAGSSGRSSGGGNYISQYYHYGHYGLDIAADYGSRVRAGGGGTVIFAGWKSNGGGYQVWIAHGSGLYTTYNHMSAVTVGRGQHVGRASRSAGSASPAARPGPHLHFEVWRGPVWDGGTRVNPLGYL